MLNRYHLADSLKEQRMLKKGEALDAALLGGRSILVIEKGLIAEHKFDGGSAGPIVGFYWPGDLVGLGWLDQKESSTLVALCESVVRCLTHAALRQIFLYDPPLGWRLFEASCSSEARRKAASATLLQRPVERRVALFLNALGDVLGEREGRALRITLPMPRTAIASALGLRCETLSRILSRWKASGVMSLEGPNVVCFPDDQDLQSLCSDAVDRPE